MAELVTPEVAKTINESPVLVSLLYAANLLPEQIDTKLKSQVMNLAVVAFRAGQESADHTRED